MVGGAESKCWTVRLRRLSNAQERVLSQWLGYVGVGAPGRGLYWRSKVREEAGRLGNGCAYLGALGPTSSCTAMKVLPGDFVGQTERHVGTGIE